MEDFGRVVLRIRFVFVYFTSTIVNTIHLSSLLIQHMQLVLAAPHLILASCIPEK